MKEEKRSLTYRLISILLAVFLVASLFAPKIDAEAAAKVTISAKKATLVLAKTKQLTLKQGTKKLTKGVKWKSSNKKIVTVSAKGKVTAKKVAQSPIPNPHPHILNIIIKIFH